jgi:hypothetical protein
MEWIEGMNETNDSCNTNYLLGEIKIKVYLFFIFSPFLPPRQVQFHPLDHSWLLPRGLELADTAIGLIEPHPAQ